MRRAVGLLSRLEAREHSVLLTVSGGAPVADTGVAPVRDTVSTWVHDTTEVPSGIVFVPGQLAPKRLIASPPPPLVEV